MDQALLHRLTHRPRDANKYDFGHVLVVGGSQGMTGAPLLAGKAALRIGAGLVTIASDVQTADKLDKRVEEIMTFALPTYSNPAEAVDALLAFVQKRKVNVAVIGPGLRPEAALFVRLLAARLLTPMVIDAGGLGAFHGQLPLLKTIAERSTGVIITPHTGEYAAIAGLAPRKSDNLRNTVADFAKQHHLTVVLKGHHTIVAHPSGSVYENKTGNPGLATAGTGDALSGVIAGLLAQGSDPAQATEAGVYLHGLAGDLSAAAKTEPGMIASDVIDFLPEAFKKASKTT